MRTLEQVEEEIRKTEVQLRNVQGTETEVYARIVGYYRAVRNWNNGKQDEFNHRKLFKVPVADSPVLAENQKTSDMNPAFPVQPGINQEQDFQNISFYEIFTRKTCPNCPPVKDFMEKISLQGKNIDVDSDSGIQEAASKGVFAAPTVIFYDKNGKETARAHTTEDLDQLFQNVFVEV